MVCAEALFVVCAARVHCGRARLEGASRIVDGGRPVGAGALRRGWLAARHWMGPKAGRSLSSLATTRLLRNLLTPQKRESGTRGLSVLSSNSCPVGVAGGGGERGSRKKSAYYCLRPTTLYLPACGEGAPRGVVLAVSQLAHHSSPTDVFSTVAMTSIVSVATSQPDVAFRTRSAARAARICASRRSLAHRVAAHIPPETGVRHGGGPS